MDQPGDRLSGWKEIGQHLRRSIRSVQRWERELQLPIARVRTARGQAVFASRLELDGWMSRLMSGRTALADDAGGATPATVRIRSIAVLPLQDRSVEPGHEFFVDGVTDALIAEFSRFQALRVISRTSILRYRDGTKAAPQVAAELGVDALLEGTVTITGGTVHVEAQLVEAKAGRQVWAGRYDRRAEDVLRLYGDVAREIADDIRVQISVSERAHLDTVRHVDPVAYDLWLKGRYLQHKTVWTRADYEQALVYFEQSAAKDPGYAPAYVGQADICHRIGGYGFWAPRVAFAKARAAADRAVSLDDTLPGAHAAVAFSRWLGDWDYAAAERHFLRAIALGSHEAIHKFGSLLALMGRHDEAISWYLQALQVNPFSSDVHWGLGKVYRLSGQHDMAVEALKSWLAVEPNDVLATFQLALVNVELAHYEDAIVILERMAATPSLKGLALGALAHALGRAGRVGDAQRRVAELEAIAAAGDYVQGWLAVAYMGVNQHDKALDALRAAIEVHDSWMPTFMKVEPALAPLRNHPGFQQLLRLAGHTA